MTMQEIISARRSVPVDAATQGKVQRAFALESSDDTWGWYQQGPADRTVEHETRFEGLEGISDTIVRQGRDGAR